MNELQLEIRARNARLREARFYSALARDFQSRLSDEFINLLVRLAAEAASGKRLLPEVEEAATAYDIAEEAGVSVAKVRKMANQYGLKTAEFGAFVLDKSKHSNKMVSNFLYNSKGRARLLELLASERGEGGKAVD